MLIRGLWPRSRPGGPYRDYTTYTGVAYGDWEGKGYGAGSREFKG